MARFVLAPSRPVRLHTAGLARSDSTSFVRSVPPSVVCADRPLEPSLARLETGLARIPMRRAGHRQRAAQPIRCIGRRSTLGAASAAQTHQRPLSLLLTTPPLPHEPLPHTPQRCLTVILSMTRCDPSPARSEYQPARRAPAAGPGAG